MSWRPIMIVVPIVGATIWFASRRESTPTDLTPQGFEPLESTTTIDLSVIDANRPTTRTEPERSEAVEGRAFESIVEHLVDLALDIHEAVEDDDQEVALELDAESRTVVQELRASVDHWDERALHAFTGLMAEDVSLEGISRRTVLATLVELGLRERWQEFTTHGRREASDAFVASMLAVVPDDQTNGVQLSRMLTDEPFVGSLHEVAILDLVDRAEHEPWLVPVAGGLLRTLWRNLESSGARSSRDLVGLAMLFLDDANQVRNAAALHHLIAAQDGRYAHIVIDRVLATRDQRLAAALAMTAARELPPERAMDVLERVIEVGDSGRYTAAFITLGERSTDVLRQRYEAKLGDLVAPHVRAELVTGAGFSQRGCVELAQLAFEQDPDLEVRTRALFVLAAQAEASLAESLLMRAIDDPSYVGGPAQIQAIVSAVKNLASAGGGAPNAVARLSARLEAHPHLSEPARRELRAIVARHVPPR